MKKKIWFKAKRFGWGWYPATWEGWLITLVVVICAIIIGLNANTLAPNDTQGVLLEFLLPLVVLIYVFLLVAHAKGEKPGWRWGDTNNRQK